MARTLTNKYALPETLVNAVSNDQHVRPGTISCTELIDAAQIRYLRMNNDYEQDVSDMIYALLGTAVHTVLERSDMVAMQRKAFRVVSDTLTEKANYFMGIGEVAKAEKLFKGANWLTSLMPVLFPDTEQRYLYEKTMTLDYRESFGHLISGTLDLYDRMLYLLQDYKFCSVYSYIYPESRIKWEEQTNVYAHMLRSEGIPVNAIRIVAIFRDWSAEKAKFDPSYPGRQIMEISIPVWEPERCERFIQERLASHARADNGIIDECTGKDRWASSSVWAVYTKGVKTPKRKLDNEPAANKWIAENQHKFKATLFTKFSPGESKRCERFCVVAGVCNQWKKEQAAAERAAG